jgi:hypothetical protein
MRSFTGEFEFKWGGDGRTMTLTSPLRYTNPKGIVWDVPAGAETDGASIPRMLWTIVGGLCVPKTSSAAYVARELVNLTQ